METEAGVTVHDRNLFLASDESSRLLLLIMFSFEDGRVLTNKHPCQVLVSQPALVIRVGSTKW